MDQLISIIKQLDIVVPMVQIDVIFLYTKNSKILSSGIKAGYKQEPTDSQGDVFPSVDVELGANKINQFLQAITGFGIFNLGQVSSTFYLSLQALEQDNKIDMESTPKVSTLNGHEAVLSIGETTYYQETQLNLQTNVNSQGILQSKVYKSISANLSVTILPIVSVDENVTLAITVDQADFGDKIDASAPPNITTQSFESLVRVKNGEMVLLGGLEKKKNNNSGSGTPFLSRIPLIKWLFSSRYKEKEKSKLHILVKTTISY